MMWTVPLKVFDIYRLSFLCADIFRPQGYDKVKTPWSSIFLWTFASIMVLIAIWTIAVVFANWFRKPKYSKKKLFRTLARRHRLSSKEVAILNQLAKKLPPSVPAAVLFIEPSYWKSVSDTQKESAHELANKIFGSAFQSQTY
jgi:hypothetical protein